MRLVNVETLKVEQFPDQSAPPYAILSHTWDDDEVAFEDMRDESKARDKQGFAKIQAAALMAISNGLSYVWVDTCCIDKSSSAELSEVINSMFGYYKNAVVCYAFLVDLPVGQDDMQHCKWFTRGWTLQELIAPTDVLFFDSQWDLKGSKLQFAAQIETITGISQWVLEDSNLLFTVSLAKRMSWASARQTTRIEDLAYCLMGIFDVNMPMIYGEGTKSFIRLQEEILKKTTDLSLFAWTASTPAEVHGLLAESPADFASCGRITESGDQYCFRGEISLTNKGVKIDTAVHFVGDETYIMDIHCYQHRDPSDTNPTRIGIKLKRSLDTFVRRSPHETVVVGHMRGSLPKTIYLMSTACSNNKLYQALSKTATTVDQKLIRFTFPTPHVTDRGQLSIKLDDIKAVPDTYWYGDEQYFSLQNLLEFKGFVRFRVTSRLSSQTPYDEMKTVEESTQFICMCDFGSPRKLRVSLYAETGLENSSKPAGFISPFKNIERYGPLGDPFSLSVLSPGDREDRHVTMMHRDQRLNYIVSATVDTTGITTPAFHVTIRLSTDDGGPRPGNWNPRFGEQRPKTPPHPPAGGDRYANASVAPFREPRFD